MPDTDTLPHQQVSLSDAEVDALCTAHGNRQDGLLEILHGVQARVGWLPDPVLRRIARRLNISKADIHGVVSFYHDFRRHPVGRHTLHVCRAEACQAVGADAVATAAEKAAGCAFHDTAADGSVTLVSSYCLGNCALGPAIMLDGRLKGRVTPAQVSALIDTLRSKS